ncbi:MAG: hypothetical protein KH543_14210 [Clostridiaceae bacterium]|nr:hypothetical protein [Clostridiaceae bacterium]
MYKELVEKLRHRGTLYNGISLFDDAADAIEKLLFKYNFANMTKKETDITLKNEFLKCLRLEAENKQLKRERDQAIKDLRHNDACEVCIGFNDQEDCDCECLDCKLKCRCKNCIDESLWQWRGVQEENNATG